MSLDTQSVKRFESLIGAKSANTNPLTFGRALRRFDKKYHEASPEMQKFMRKVMIHRINEGEVMLKGRRFTPTEKQIVRENLKAYKGVWKDWVGET